MLEEIKRLNINTPVCMFSSSSDPLDVVKSNSYKQVIGYIAKPIDESKVRQLLSLIL